MDYVDYTARRRQFRNLLNGAHCTYPASVFDAGSARIAESLGYRLNMFSGSVAAIAILGATDDILITMTEFVERCRLIQSSCNLPLLVDGDHGYGNALNVMRMVRELEAAGVSAMSIEDTELPAAYGVKTPRLVSLEEAVGKMRAAVAARRDPETVIIARTSAQFLASTDEAVSRVKAFCTTGADAIFIAGRTGEDQMRAIATVSTLPIVHAGPPGAMSQEPMASELGIKVALKSHAPIVAAYAAIYECLAHLSKEGNYVWAGEKDFAPKLQTFLDADPVAAAKRDFMNIQ